MRAAHSAIALKESTELVQGIPKACIYDNEANTKALAAELSELKLSALQQRATGARARARASRVQTLRGVSLLQVETECEHGGDGDDQLGLVRTSVNPLSKIGVLDSGVQREGWLSGIPHV